MVKFVSKYGNKRAAFGKCYGIVGLVGNDFAVKRPICELIGRIGCYRGKGSRSCYIMAVGCEIGAVFGNLTANSSGDAHTGNRLFNEASLNNGCRLENNGVGCVGA